MNVVQALEAGESQPDARLPRRNDGLFAWDEDGDIPVKIKAIGIGCAGGHAIDAMIEAQVEGIEFVVANSDWRALNSSLAPTKIQLGARLTTGLGAGGNPELGRRAALEAIEQLSNVLQDADMVFVIAGMGGGAGTGATPIIASIAKEKGCLTVGVVTKPLLFEGKRRLIQAEAGLRELRSSVDTLIMIPSQRLLGALGKQTSLRDAFRRCDDILRLAVQAISDLITSPGLINLDFADVQTIMSESGMALLGMGVARGENRAVEAAQKAISSRLLEDRSIAEARGVLISILGGPDLTLFEVNEASSMITEAAHEDAHIIFGSVIDEHMAGEMRVTLVATGFEAPDERTPAVLSTLSTPPKIPPFTRKTFFPGEDAPSVPFTSEVQTSHPCADIVGQNEYMRDILRLLPWVAGSDATVLITGEGGTGRALIARAIHRQSHRARKPFVAVHCGAIPEQSIESELFGHEPGTLLGAVERRIGAFERARGGTLFLNDIDTMPLETQAELLRVLQRGAIERLGGEPPIAIEVRLVAATTVDVQALVRTKAFREDLYYRLNVVPIYVPPLRERTGDIPLLVQHFLEKHARRYNRPVRGVAPAAMEALQAYDWPGNVRQLEHRIERVVVLGTHDIIQREDLPFTLRSLHALDGCDELRSGPTLSLARQSWHAPLLAQFAAEGVDLYHAVQQFERAYIRRVLEKTQGNSEAAARLLGIPPDVLRGKIAPHARGGI